MRYPNFSEEKKLWRKGYKRVVGLDESGRGPLAGPVVAAAVIISQSLAKKSLLHSNILFFDSKKLSAKKREEPYQIIINHPQIKWGIGRVSEKVIDRINILVATKLAMQRAIKNLEKRLERGSGQKIRDRGFFARGSFLIIDGNFGLDLDIPQKSIIKADEKVFSCVAASIIAKVTRDRIMVKYHKKYPKYGFDKHKGYPTKFHREMIKKYGPSVIHRLTFKHGKKC